MKKAATIVIAAVIVLLALVVVVLLTGCGTLIPVQDEPSQATQTPVPTPPEADFGPSPMHTPREAEEDEGYVPTSTKKATNSVTEEEICADVKRYADAYLSGEWDGSPIYRDDHQYGEYPYAEVDEDGWLWVASGKMVVFPGATLPSMTVDRLVEAYEDGEWVRIPYSYRPNFFIWSEDYMLQAEINAATGYMSMIDKTPGKNAYFLNLTVVDAEEVERFETEDLVRLFQNGAWTGERIWSPETGAVAELDEVIGIKIYRPDSGWEFTHVFPAIDETFSFGLACYEPESRLTVAITERGIGLYRPNGEVAAFYTVKCDTNIAFIGTNFRTEEGRYVDFVYDSVDTVYMVDYDGAQLIPVYQGVNNATWNGEGRIHIYFTDPIGMVHAVSNP